MDEWAETSVCYAAVFREGGGSPLTGAVVLEGERMLLVGGGALDCIGLELRYEELSEVRIGRSRDERLNGRPTLVLDRPDAAPVLVQPLETAVLHELTDLVSTLTARGARRVEVAVAVSFDPMRRDRVREVIAEGPPFDPAALGLQRHEVYLGEREAFFVLSGPHAEQTLERAIREPGFWRAGLVWRRLLVGQPRVVDAGRDVRGELVYRWEGPAPAHAGVPRWAAAANRALP
jgi:hypothetical protein